MGNKYSLIDDDIEDMADRGFQKAAYFRELGYSRLVGTGKTYEEALKSLTLKCKHNGLWDPKKHPTKEMWHCGIYIKTDWRGNKYKLFHPVFFYKKANTCVAYTYYLPV